MAPVRAFGPGVLARPLLPWRRADLHRYAQAQNLRWLEDPSNQNEFLDRNYLRRHVLPSLEGRWPAASGSIARSAAYAAESGALLIELAEQDLAACKGEQDRQLQLQGLRALSPARRRNLLSYWLRGLHMPSPPSGRLEEAATSLVEASDDARPCIAWPGAELRRYRNRVYAMRPLPPPPESWFREWTLREPLQLPAGCGCLTTEKISGSVLSTQAAPLRVEFRSGGERLRPAGSAHTRPLKQLWQETGIPPWERARTPLLFRGDALVAVADRWISNDWAATPGLRFIWENELP
jgi:tRNA(Ile)-lysidine synthase